MSNRRSTNTRQANTSSLTERFHGEAGRRRLIECLRGQAVLEGNADLAEGLASISELLYLRDGELLMEQGAADDDLYFILSGRVAVQVNGRPVAHREAGTYVGEMALIDPTARRCATVVAVGEVVAAKVPEPTFTDLADRCPRLWRRLAVELGCRLRQRNVLVTSANPEPTLIVGSSSESLPAAQALQAGLEYDGILVRLWTDDVFTPSHYPVDDLLHQVQTVDFAALVFAPDDLVFSRRRASPAPRDNVLFELGLFMGTLGRERTLVVRPRDAKLKIPSDLLGLNLITYQAGDGTDLRARLGAACTEIRNVIRRLGCR